ncbi:Sensor protein FixL [Rubripirellula tenax]|uniref:Sensor protein FixL n=1 Tax=Rubripirellula tenax TaxID=2528015 RepID=A0A5C6E900_9BACT|nr:PAS domain S-box protein [Rubripirellula tenax]TWU46133.1 Sensor protein FixL [Rubripirellula tenax]
MLEHEQLAILASVLETAVDAIVIIDDVGTIVSVNPSTERLFGYSADEMLKQNVKMLMPSPYHGEHDGYLKRYHETHEPRIIGIGREVVGKRKDDTTFPLHLAVSETKTVGRRLFTGIMRDISELKAAEVELKQLNASLDQRVQLQADAILQTQAELVEKEKFAALGRISGGISHEIRNPLNAIKTSAYYLLHAQSPTEEKTREHLTRIDRQVAIIDSVVTALTDLARLPAPKMDRFNIEMVLRDIVQRKGLSSNVSVQFEFAPDAPDVIADERQIPIVFANLIRNARDAMPDGGTLTLSGRIDDEQMIVRVSDTGTGITPEVLTRMNEPFFSTKAHGMGLGMAITKSIVEKNRGTIRVETKLGEGTTFFVSLPSSAAKQNRVDP